MPKQDRNIRYLGMNGPNSEATQGPLMTQWREADLVAVVAPIPTEKSHSIRSAANNTLNGGTRAATLFGNGSRRRRYRPPVFCRKAPDISRNLFPKSGDYIDGRRTGHESCTNLEYCIDLFANDKMRFVLRINAAARKLRDAKSNYLARFQY
jgi:hypothetical protein